MRRTSRSSSAAVAISASLVAQGFDGVEPGGAPRRIKRGEEGKHERHDDDGGDLAAVDAGGDAGEEIDLGGEQVGADYLLNKLPYRFDVVGEDDTEDKAREGANDADAGAAQHEDSQYHRARGAHRAQDRDVPSLVLHHHDHARDDVERGDENDQRQDQEHDVALDLDGVEQARIGLLPADDPRLTAEGGGNLPALLAHPVGVGDKDFETGNLIGEAEKQLRRRERRIDKAVVIFVHADIEQRDDLVGLDPRHRPERGGGPLG